MLSSVSDDLHLPWVMVVMWRLDLFLVLSSLLLRGGTLTCDWHSIPCFWRVVPRLVTGTL